ncbi:conjugal transfer protein TraX [Enterococcus sp. BWT-B8]|uniref:TraX family protein n=1 Tax=Enterococcus sp. BWT-B8 TaxID=2885157 RepID=UPI001E38F2DC|nr:TraX family protein [Enterococcus sp. BWT-B8]MCB5951894.1 conjugal transfer protein TraX [Enterococcus sp. BWT-B8]
MNKKGYFSGSTLKWIAIITMFMDHSAKLLYLPQSIIEQLPPAMETFYTALIKIFDIFLILGRLSFPFFCFLLVEGFVHTSNVKKYFSRLLIFALISEVPYDLAFRNSFFTLEKQNVFFTLLIGLVVLMGLEKVKERTPLNIILSLGIVFAGIFTAEFLQTDYGGWIGVLLISVLYYLREYPLVKCLAGGLVILQNSISGLFSFIFIYFYNGQRGRQWKYLFYWFYPAHLLVLIGIQQYILLPYIRMIFSTIP